VLTTKEFVAQKTKLLEGSSADVSTAVPVLGRVESSGA
jgi:hypothetical protein